PVAVRARHGRVVERSPRAPAARARSGRAAQWKIEGTMRVSHFRLSPVCPARLPARCPSGALPERVTNSPSVSNSLDDADQGYRPRTGNVRDLVTEKAREAQGHEAYEQHVGGGAAGEDAQLHVGEGDGAGDEGHIVIRKQTTSHGPDKRRCH